MQDYGGVFILQTQELKDMLEEDGGSSDETNAVGVRTGDGRAFQQQGGEKRRQGVGGTEDGQPSAGDIDVSWIRHHQRARHGLQQRGSCCGRRPNRAQMVLGVSQPRVP